MGHIMNRARPFTPVRHPGYSRLTKRIVWAGAVVLGAFLGFMIVMLAGAVLLKMAKRGTIWIIPLIWLFLKIQKLEKSNRELQLRIASVPPLSTPTAQDENQ